MVSDLDLDRNPKLWAARLEMCRSINPRAHLEILCMNFWKRRDGWHLPYGTSKLKSLSFLYAKIPFSRHNFQIPIDFYVAPLLAHGVLIVQEVL